MTAAPPAPADTSPPPADPTPADVPSSPVFAPDDAPRREFHPRPAAWRGDAGPPSPIRAFTATLLLASVVAGMAVGLAALPRRPAPVSFVSVPVGEYEDPAWPVNPWANRDAELLAGRFGPSAVTAFGFQERDRFRSLLGWLGGTGTTGLPKPDGRRTVVFHLTALASVRGGTAYLLPADARPDDAGGWVPLADVIRAAADRGVSRTLLLLDIRPAADAVGGPLGDDAVAVVHEALRATPPEFPVLVACGPGEVSLPATPAGSSAFAFYLAEGLGGAADGFGEEGRNRPDGEVTVRELARFTAARVDRWARLVHGRRQTPTLHAPPADRSADFVLFRRPDWRPPDPAPAAGYPAWLRSAWDARDSLRGGDRARRDPVAFARLTAGLLAAEDWWYNAASTTRAEEVWRTARADWERAAARTPLPPDWAKFPAVAARLPVARTGAPEAPPEVAKSFSAFLSAKQEQETEALAAWGAAARPHRAAAIGLVWAQAVDTTAPSAEQADKWGRAAAAVDPTNPLAESRVLTAVAGRGSFRRQRLAAFPSAAVAALFRAEDELARVVALGPVEFVAVTELVTDADRHRRAGADRLWTATSAADVTAAATELDAAAAGYRTARERGGRTRAAGSALDAATRLLGETLPGMIESDRPPAVAWRAVADAAMAVGPESPPPAVAALTAATARLTSAYDPALVQRLTAPDHKADATGVADLRPLLAGAALTGEGRAKVWGTLLADEARLHAAVREQDAAGDLPPPPVPPAEPAAARRLRRAEASVRLLRLAGVAAGAEDLLRKAMANDSAADWAALEGRLRAAWLKELPETVARGGEAGARAAHLVPPAAARYRVWAEAPVPKPPTDPHAAYRRWAESAAQPAVMEDAR